MRPEVKFFEKARVNPCIRKVSNIESWLFMRDNPQIDGKRVQ